MDYEGRVRAQREGRAPIGWGPMGRLSGEQSAGVSASVLPTVYTSKPQMEADHAMT